MLQLTGVKATMQRGLKLSGIRRNLAEDTSVLKEARDPLRQSTLKIMNFRSNFLRNMCAREKVNDVVFR